MSQMWQDLRHGARVLRQAPGFTIVAAAVLAVGVGAATAMFSVLDAALVRPLPFPGADRLVAISEQSPGRTHNHVAPLNFLDWRDQNRSFTAMAAVAGAARTVTGPDGMVERVQGQAVTPAFFD